MQNSIHLLWLISVIKFLFSSLSIVFRDYISHKKSPIIRSKLHALKGIYKNKQLKFSIKQEHYIKLNFYEFSLILITDGHSCLRFEI